MACELIDTHTHVTDPAFDADRMAVLQRAKEAGVVACIDMGTTIENSRTSAALAKEQSMVYAACGLHPEEAREMTAVDDDVLAALAQEPKVVAIGEIGLDYHWEKDEEKRALQRRIFIRQLDLARNLHLPVCIHDRDAHGDTLRILQNEGKGLRGVLHCFSGSLEMARAIVRLGFYLGVDGPLTYKNAAKLPEIVQAMPLECLLVETDAPYLSPVPLRGQRNEPKNVLLTAKKAAELHDETFEDFCAATTRNARRLYNL